MIYISLTDDFRTFGHLVLWPLTVEHTDLLSITWIDVCWTSSVLHRLYGFELVFVPCDSVDVQLEAL
jgi:hypothetical protein